MNKLNIFLLTLVTLMSMVCSCDSDESVEKPVEKPISTIELGIKSVSPELVSINDVDYTIYFVDSEEGDDTNDGLSEANAFRSLGKISQMAHEPKTKVLIKKGSTFDKQDFYLVDCKGTSEHPFIVDIYGDGDRPVISGYGVCVRIKDSNIRINNLLFTSLENTANIGVKINDKGSDGATSNIVVANCRFEKINWAGDDEVVGVSPTDLDVSSITSEDRYQKHNGGVIARVSTDNGARWFENIFVVNNEFYKVSRTAVLIEGVWGQRSQEGKNDFANGERWPATNIIIKDNTMEYLGGDGVIANGCDKTFIEGNKCYYANYLGRTSHASAGLWPYQSTNTVMQYNEVGYTQWCNGSSDGEGLDVDVACKNTLIQFNYVHNNVGGGVLMCNRNGFDHTNTTVRNNIFYRNGGVAKGSMFVINSSVDNVKAYNNLVVVDKYNARILSSDNHFQDGHGENFEFNNNIFMSLTPAIPIFDDTWIKNCVFDNNMYYNLEKPVDFDQEGVMLDPQITFLDVMEGYDIVIESCVPKNEWVYKNSKLFDGMAPVDIRNKNTKGIAYFGPHAAK